MSKAKLIIIKWPFFEIFIVAFYSSYFLCQMKNPILFYDY